jgi:acetyl-CoA carboxylase biotin carboxyl carrier protein
LKLLTIHYLLLTNKMNEPTGVAESREENAESGQSGEQQRDPNRRGGGRGNRHRGHQPRQGGGGQHQQAKSSLNLNELRELAELINQHGFTDFEFENENIRVRLRKELAPQIVQAAPQAVSYQPAPTIPTVSTSAAPAQAAESTATQTAPASADDEANLKKITSPIVGTFYKAPSPDAEPFVKIGSTVTAETIVCIVEAMKLMNEIPAEISGEIVKIYVDNGQPVEYGQPLFAVK